MIATLRRRLANDQGGFTLIELLVVIIIIGILLAIAVPSYLGFRARAQKSAAQSNVRAIIPAIEAYYSDTGTYASMTVAALKTSYDQSIDTSKYTLEDLTASVYCVRTTEGSTTAWKTGPSGPISTTETASSACP